MEKENKFIGKVGKQGQKQDKQNEDYRKLQREIVLKELKKFGKKDEKQLSRFKKGTKEYDEFFNLIQNEEQKIQLKYEKIKNEETSIILSELRKLSKDNGVKSLNPVKLACTMFNKWKNGSLNETNITELLNKMKDKRSYQLEAIQNLLDQSNVDMDGTCQNQKVALQLQNDRNPDASASQVAKCSTKLPKIIDVENEKLSDCEYGLHGRKYRKLVKDLVKLNGQIDWKNNQDDEEGNHMKMTVEASRDRHTRVEGDKIEKIAKVTNVKEKNCIRSMIANHFHGNSQTLRVDDEMVKQNKHPKNRKNRKNDSKLIESDYQENNRKSSSLNHRENRKTNLFVHDENNNGL